MGKESLGVAEEGGGRLPGSWGGWSASGGGAAAGWGARPPPPPRSPAAAGGDRGQPDAGARGRPRETGAGGGE